MTFKFLIYIWNFFVFRWRCWSCVEGQVLRWVRYSTFSHSHKIGNNGINGNFVLPYNCSFLYYLHHMMLVNVKLDVSWYEGLPFKLADFSILNGLATTKLAAVLKKCKTIIRPDKSYLDLWFEECFCLCVYQTGDGAPTYYSARFFFLKTAWKQRKLNCQ